MAKQKKEKQILLKDCGACVSHQKHDGSLYCALMMKGKNVFSDTSKVTKRDCIWFKMIRM